nr:hypothetical protein [Anaplasma phagocytophilum]
MSGYAYSGLSSREYKDSLCRAITTGLIPYDEFLKVLRECVLELSSTLNELRGLDGAFEANVHRVEILQRDINAEIATGAEPTGRVLHGMMHKLYDVLYDCVTAQCNQDVTRFIDSRFIRHGAHLQIAKACGVLVNSIIIVNCCAKTFAGESYTVGNEEDKNNAFKTGIALSAYVHTEFSAASRCLNPSAGPEETKRRKAILRVLRHNIELCNKVAELVDPNMLRCFRDRTGGCVDSLLAAVRSSSAECKEMVCNNESVQRRLAIARKALLGFRYYFRVYSKSPGFAHDFRLFKKGKYTVALVHMMGSLFSMYRGYASTGNTEHASAAIIEHCLKILLTLPSTRRSLGAYYIRKAYVDMCSVYEEIEQHLRPELLLNPGAEVKLRDSALRYLSEMMKIWEKEYGRYFNAVEQTGGSPSQPSTSGMGSTSAGMGGPQASYVPPHDQGIMPYLWDQPSTSWDQLSTSGLGSTRAGMGRSQAPHMPPQDQGTMPHAYAQPSTSYAHPSTLWDQPSTSGLGSTSAGLGQQAPYIPPHDSGIMFHAYAQPSTSYAHPSTSWDQPSTSGLGSTSAGLGQQAPYIPPHDPGIMFHAYAQPSTSYAHPSTSWDQPSTSGLGSTDAGQGAQLVPPPPHIPLRVLENVPYPSSQPSTSGLGSTSAGMGSQQAPYVPPRDPMVMSYSCDQPSTSGMGDASSELEEAQVSSHRSRTPSDDSEPPSKRARSA